jgi:hypothetical protein
MMIARCDARDAPTARIYRARGRTHAFRTHFARTYTRDTPARRRPPAGRASLRAPCDGFIHGFVLGLADTGLYMCG